MKIKKNGIEGIDSEDVLMKDKTNPLGVLKLLMSTFVFLTMVFSFGMVSAAAAPAAANSKSLEATITYSKNGGTFSPKLNAKVGDEIIIKARFNKSMVHKPNCDIRIFNSKYSKSWDMSWVNDFNNFYEEAICSLTVEKDDAGLYNIELIANDISGNNPVKLTPKSGATFTVVDTTAPTLTLSQNPTAPTYGNVTINVTATDNAAISTTKWASGKQDASYFGSAGTVVSGNSFTVSENGDYTVYTVDTSGNTTVQTITVRNIEKYTYAIYPISDQTMTPLKEDYKGTQDTKTITIKNTGTGKLTSLKVQLSIDSKNGKEFTIGDLSRNILESKEEATFTICADNGLRPGTHTATVTISAKDIYNKEMILAKFTVTQVVSPKPVYDEPKVTVTASKNNENNIVFTSSYTISDSEKSNLIITDFSTLLTRTRANSTTEMTDANFYKGAPFVIDQPDSADGKAKGNPYYSITITNSDTEQFKYWARPYIIYKDSSDKSEQPHTVYGNIEFK